MEKKQHGNLADEIRQRLEEEINNGTLMPGDALDERKLAERFGVSRTPIREAIYQLDAQGLVRNIPRQGVYVARMSIRELLAMFELQAELEGICAGFSARRMSNEQRQELQAIHERMRPAVDVNDIALYAQGNADFHELIYVGGQNRYLAEQVRMIRRRTEIFRQNTFQREKRITESFQEHSRVVEAILAGSQEEARRAMCDHISVGGRGFAEFVMTLPEQLLETHEQAYPMPKVDVEVGKKSGVNGAVDPKASKRPRGRPRLNPARA